jgi:hypothetical protein
VPLVTLLHSSLVLMQGLKQLLALALPLLL